MTGRSVRLYGAVVACALAAAAAASVCALPKPRYPVDGGQSAHGKKHPAKTELAGGPKGEHAGKGTYVVAHGDTLSSIARKLGVPQKDLAEANDLHGHALKPGMKLHVPHVSARDQDREEADASPHGRKGKAEKTEPEGKTYTVAHGDTLSSIARRFGVSSRDLADANDVHGALRSGMKLHIPSEGGLSKAGPSKGGDLREASSDERPAKSKHAEAAEASSYTVRHGDTLGGVANRLHVSQRALADANDLHGRGLRPGMKLKIPRGEAPVEVARADHGDHVAEKPPAAHATTYTVARGDTLAGVARRFHLSQQAIADANDLHGRGLRSGMKLKIPGGEDAPIESARADRGVQQPAPGGGTYTVARGDTLTGVARRFHVSARALRAANDLEPDEPLDHGMKLKLPGDAHDHGRDAHANGLLVAPKVRLAAAGPAPVKPAVRTPVEPPADTEEPGDAPIQVADATPEPQRSPPPSAPAVYARPAPAAGAPPRTGPVLPRPRPSSTGVAPGDTEGPPPAPGAPTFRAANDHAAVAPIHPPVTHGYPSPTELASLGKGRFIWPVKGEVVTRFGDMGHDLKNDGLNIEADLGTSVRSAADGQVVYAGDSVPGFGNMVLVKHADGWITAYGHLARIDVKIAQRVSQGEEIGQVGQSGGVERPQLHFEVRYAPPSSREKARPVDPSMLLP